MQPTRVPLRSNIRPLSQRIPASKPATVTKRDYCGGSIIPLKFFVTFQGNVGYAIQTDLLEFVEIRQ
jgi:hypothetical protein